MDWAKTAARRDEKHLKWVKCEMVFVESFCHGTYHFWPHATALYTKTKHAGLYLMHTVQLCWYTQLSPVMARSVFSARLKIDTLYLDWNRKKWIAPSLTLWPKCCIHYPDNKVNGANMGPTWFLLAPDGPHAPCYQGSRWFKHGGTVPCEIRGTNVLQEKYSLLTHVMKVESFAKFIFE